MSTFDVLVLGEVLVELSAPGDLHDGAELRLGFSGDALNAAAAAAAAGARTALLARVADDELGAALEQRVAALGVSTELLRRVPGQHGVYFVAADPSGQREFVYVRRGSAGSTLEPADVDAARVQDAGVVLAGGIAAAVSASAAAAVEHAARRARRFVYDPNFRPRLTSAQDAAAALARVAPHAEVVTPACPGETSALLGTDDPVEGARRVRALGARVAAVTRGADGVLLDDGSGPLHVPPLPPPALVDQTGAGDTLVGTVAARLALGDDVVTAVRLGCAAASLSLRGRGGTGHLPPLAETRAHLTAHAGPAGGRR
ncbi:carbohydrate kinase family protein [Kineococcus gypseus]|uniref:carbohydrate kinase family protein n=1 Tax=Kineococcus gypseus TaxID=1637102 RepID=UPI003D7E66AB